MNPLCIKCQTARHGHPAARGTVGFFFEVVRLEGELLRERGLITLLDTPHHVSGGSPWLSTTPDSERGEENFKITL